MMLPTDLAFSSSPYYWQVQVWDSQNNHLPDFVNGGAFPVPAHAYPSPDFSNPSSVTLIGGQVNVSFDASSSKCYSSPQQCTYAWDFNFPNNDISYTGSSTNPSHVYSQVKTYSPMLTVCDPTLSGCCSKTGSVTVRSPRSTPQWKEISPF